MIKSSASVNCFMGCAFGVVSKLLAEPKITEIFFSWKSVTVSRLTLGL